MLARTRVIEDTAFSARFPAERLARVAITLRNGERLTSAPTVARGDPEAPLADDEVVTKFRRLADVLAPGRGAEIERSIATLETNERALPVLMDAVLASARGEEGARR
jgi:2-methylcitrate dehydratase PrpD